MWFSAPFDFNLPSANTSNNSLSTSLPISYHSPQKLSGLSWVEGLKKMLKNPCTVRILCMVTTCPGNELSKAVHVQATWGRRCDTLIFVSSAGVLPVILFYPSWRCTTIFCRRLKGFFCLWRGKFRHISKLQIFIFLRLKMLSRIFNDQPRHDEWLCQGCSPHPQLHLCRKCRKKHSTNLYISKTLEKEIKEHKKLFQLSRPETDCFINNMIIT